MLSVVLGRNLWGHPTCLGCLLPLQHLAAKQTLNTIFNFHLFFFFIKAQILLWFLSVRENRYSYWLFLKWSGVKWTSPKQGISILISSLLTVRGHIRACVFRSSVVSDSLWPPQAVARQTPLSLGFSQQEYWSGLSFPPPGDLPDTGIEPTSPALASGFFTHHWLGFVIFILQPFMSSVDKKASCLLRPIPPAKNLHNLHTGEGHTFFFSVGSDMHPFYPSDFRFLRNRLKNRGWNTHPHFELLKI